MYMYGTCPEIVIETLMVEHFGVHHKGHKPYAYDQFISSSLYLFFLFCHNNYKCEELVSNSKMWKCTCIEHAQKLKLYDQHFGVHHKGQKPFLTLGPRE